MLVLFWNCRGLAHSSTSCSLRAMLRQSNPDCLCIVETKISYAKGVIACLGYPETLDVPAVGTRGGLIFAWRRGIDFDMVSINQHLCSVILFGEPNSQPWAMTLVHSPCDSISKEAFWDEVGSIGSAFGDPWMILGDFNAILGQHEKWRAQPVGSSSSDGFYQFKLLNGMVDVRSTGPQFTWCNGRSGHQQIREHLDKGLANGDWSALFPRALIRNLSRYLSDHAPILLNTIGAMGAGPKPFRFESCWVRDKSSKEVVKAVWGQPMWGSAGFRLSKKIKATSKALRIWNRECFGNVQRSIQKLNEQLEFVQGLTPSDQAWEIEQRIRTNLLEVLKREECIWRQKSKVS